jgi:hypothetical protein
MKDIKAEKKRYEKPQMSVMRINRFFFGGCQVTWPACYSQYMVVNGACRYTG